jgi:hypothetical protein
MNIKLSGTKIVEVPYFIDQIDDIKKSILIVGERHGGEGVSETLFGLGARNVTTTDIVSVQKDSWLDLNGKEWKHVEADFIQYDENLKYDYIIAVSVFEHFGFWFSGNKMASGVYEEDVCRWNHDIKGILKGCKLLKDERSKFIITLPAGPYMNYEKTGEPFLRSYDHRRQSILKNEVVSRGYSIADEKFYYSADFLEWYESDNTINDPKNYNLYSAFTPNVIWAFTIQKI